MAAPDFDALNDELLASLNQPIRVETDAGVIEMPDPSQKIQAIQFVQSQQAKVAGTPVGPRFSKFRMGGTG